MKLIWLLPLFKFSSAIWIVIVAGNFFRSLYWVFDAIKHNMDVDAVSTGRARRLLLFGIVAEWITALAIDLGEQMIGAVSTGYSANLLLYTGALLLVITVLSAVFSVAAAWNRNIQDRSCVSAFESLAGLSFVFAMVLWFSVLVILWRREGGMDMVEKLAGTMHMFGIVFSIVAIVAAVASYLAAMDSAEEAAALAKGFFKTCLFVAILLWIISWLIS